jgi:hypothetical protein
MFGFSGASGQCAGDDHCNDKVHGKSLTTEGTKSTENSTKSKMKSVSKS